ncbi:MAG: hypothetical protein L7U60_06175 [Bacteroidia bacterium]|nr:hypothetical protein [Bacteroidia bacterium]
MTNQSNSSNIFQLPAIWAFLEVTLGGILHALRVPLTGFLVGGSAVIILAVMSLNTTNKVKTILQATFYVILVKAGASPHSPPPALLDRIEENFGFAPPREHGYDVVDSIKAMHSGKVKVFFAMGGNFLSATPDTLYTAEALEKTELTVQVSTKLNRSHLITGKEALILPCFGRTDHDYLNGELQFVTTENSMGVIQMSKGVLKPVSENLKSEPMIVSHLADAYFGEESPVRWRWYMESYDNIRCDIERTIPGFDHYNDRVRLPGGFYLPDSSREGNFDNTATGKANFNLANVKPIHLEGGELMMQTLRSHD